MAPRFSISNHPFLGRGGAAVYYLFMSEHTDPRGSDIGLVHVSMLPAGPETHVCEDPGLRGEGFALPALPHRPPRSVPREGCVPHPSCWQGTQPPPPPGEKSLLLHRRFLRPAPPTPTPFRECGDQLPPLITLLAGPFSKDLIRFLITTQCAIGFFFFF